MKNLIKLVETEQKNRLESFINDINQLTDRSQLDTWHYRDLLPKGKNVKDYSFDTLKAYLIGRKEKAVYKAIEREVKRINTVANAGELVDIKINIEWKYSRTWGANPHAECWYGYKDTNGNYCTGYVTGTASGCGYDKQSQAVAVCLNQINEVLKPLYLIKNANPANNNSNHELLGYGAGYGILPSIEGGVGVSCYPSIFDKIGFEFKTVASGKMFDSYSITKKQTN